MYAWSQVANLGNLYKENLPEIPKLRSLIENIKLLFSLPQTNIKVEVAEGERAYRITLLDRSVQKIPLGYFVYLPLERRLDAYTTESPGIPLLQWKGRRVVYKNYSPFLDYCGLSQLFSKLSNVL